MRRRSFTLIEALIAVAVLGVLGAAIAAAVGILGRGSAAAVAKNRLEHALVHCAGQIGSELREASLGTLQLTDVHPSYGARMLIFQPVTGIDAAGDAVLGPAVSFAVQGEEFVRVENSESRVLAGFAAPADGALSGPGLSFAQPDPSHPELIEYIVRVQGRDSETGEIRRRMTLERIVLKNN